MPRKPGFTSQEHKQTGKKLKEIRKELISIQKNISQKYRLDSKALKRCCSLTSTISELRCELDRLYCMENPDKDFKGIYY